MDNNWDLKEYTGAHENESLRRGFNPLSEIRLDRRFQIWVEGRF
jgi:hypothetical protein